MGKLSISAAISKYNELYQVEFEAGIGSSAQFDQQWRPFVWAPTQEEISGVNVAYTAINGAGMPLYGGGNPLQYTTMSVYETFVEAQQRGLGFAVDTVDFEEDKAGLYNGVSFSLGQKARRFPWIEFWRLMTGPAFDGSEGFSGPDDTTLFSASHPFVDENGATVTYSNTTTAAFSENAYNSAIQAIRQFRSFSGEYLGVGEDWVVVVGPSNEALARSLFEASLVNGGDTNTIIRPKAWFVNHYLVGSRANYWFLMRMPMNPRERFLLVHEPQQAMLVSDMDQNSESVWTNSEYRWRVQQRFGIGPNMPSAAYGSTGAG